VKQVQEASIASVAEAEEANQAGDAGPLRAAREADQGQNHPEEGVESSRCGAECAHGIEPGGPERHNANASMNADSSTVLPVTGCASRHLLRYALDDDHLQGKALAAANREGESATGGARRSASGQLVDAVERLRDAGMPVQGHAARKARPYYQVSFTRKGKSSSKFVRKEDLAAVRRD